MAERSAVPEELDDGECVLEGVIRVVVDGDTVAELVGGTVPVNGHPRACCEIFDAHG